MPSGSCVSSSLEARRTLKTACELLFILACIPFFVLGSVPRKEIELRIKKIESAPQGFLIFVDVKNVGDRPFVLAKTYAPYGFPSDVLQSLDVQQWDSKLGWQHVGPCHDIAPITTITLTPGEVIQDSVPIGDKAHEWGGAPCPVRVAHLGGKIRAILYYVYASQADYEGRKANHTNLISPYIELPAVGH